MIDKPVYCTDHEPYVNAVVAALARAGIGVAAARSSTNRPMQSWIELDGPASRRAGFDRPVFLFWDEVTGWCYGPEESSPVGTGCAEWLEYLGTAIIPMPDEIAAEAAKIVIDNADAGSATTPKYRDWDDEDDIAGQLARAAATHAQR